MTLLYVYIVPRVHVKNSDLAGKPQSVGAVIDSRRGQKDMSRPFLFKEFYQEKEEFKSHFRMSYFFSFRF
jgi:hypothetical protein